MIETVVGPMAPESLGITSMHDHVLADSSRLQADGTVPAPTSDPMSAEWIDYLESNQLALADNLRLDDPEVAIDELRHARATGLRSLVECTSWGLGPRHIELPAIARASGLTIVCSYGTYIPRTVPTQIRSLSEEELEEDFVRALCVAVPGTDFRAGIIGIMGTTGTVTAGERATLRAGARAARRTGAAITVRLDPAARSGLDVVELVAAEGVPADRIVFTNADEFMDESYWDELSDTGAVLEMCFGTEACHPGRVDNPTDARRHAFFAEFISRHPDSSHTLGQSIWTKTQLTRYGGIGYGNLLAQVVPMLRARGMTAERLDEMLVHTPRRLLDRDAVSTS